MSVVSFVLFPPSSHPPPPLPLIHPESDEGLRWYNNPYVVIQIELNGNRREAHYEKDSLFTFIAYTLTYLSLVSLSLVCCCADCTFFTVRLRRNFDEKSTPVIVSYVHNPPMSDTLRHRNRFIKNQK